MADSELLETQYSHTLANNREVRRAIKQIVRAHDAKWPQQVTTEMIHWLLHSTTLVSLMCLVLYIVSLFFPSTGDRTTTRIIVETCIFLGLILMSFLVRLRLAWLDHTAAVTPVKLLLHTFKEADTKMIEDVTSFLTISQVQQIVTRSIYRRSAQYQREHLSPLNRILRLIHDRVVFGLVASLVISLIAAIVRVSVQSGPVRGQWHVIFFEQKIYIVLPLLEFVTPLVFFIVSSIQNARVLALFQTQEVTQTKVKAEDLNPWSPGDRGNGSPKSDGDDSSSELSSESSVSSSSSALSSSSSTDDSLSNSSSDSSDYGKYSVPVNSLGDLEAGHHSKATLPIPRRMACSALTRDYFYRIIRGDESLGSLPRNSAADILANVTMLACVDQRPVREPHPFAEKVLLMGRMHSRSSSLATNASKHNLQDASEAAAHNAVFTYDRIPKLHRGATGLPIILHVQPKSTTELEFVDPEWRIFMNALKPLGLNCMLNGAFAETQHDMDLSDFDEGLRKLAKAIGFSDGSILAYDFILELRSDTTRLKNAPKSSVSRRPSHGSGMSHHNPRDAQSAPAEETELTTVPEATEPSSLSSNDEDNDSEIPYKQVDLHPTSQLHEPSPSVAEAPSASLASSLARDSSPSPSDHSSMSKQSNDSDEFVADRPSAAEKDKNSVDPKAGDSADSSGTKPELMPAKGSPSRESSDATLEPVHSKASEARNMEPSGSSSIVFETPSPEGQSSQTPTGDSSDAPSSGADPSFTPSPANGSGMDTPGLGMSGDDHRSAKEQQEPMQAHPMSEKATYLVVRNNASSKLELLTTGDPLVVLSHCTQYWNGFEIKKLTKVDRRNIRQVHRHWAHHQSFLCVGHSYRPVPTDYYKAVLAASALQAHQNSSGAPKSLKGSLTRQDRTRSVSSYDSEEFLDLDEIKNDQIWIGLVGLRHQPKPVAPLFVDHLDHSHIRFVYFSEENEQHSKAFADKLGLETGWNSCITLKDRPPVESETPEESIQKLPVGISNVRDHLIDIDNVPLLVRLFVDSTASNKAQMIQIAEEFGEVCFSMGTLADSDNQQAFLESSLSFGLLPDAAKQETDALQSRSETDSLSSSDDFDDDSSTASHHRTKSPPKSPELHHHHHSKAKTSANAFLLEQLSSGALVTDILRLSCHFVSKKPQSFVDIVELLTLGRRLEQQTLMFAWLFIFAHAALNIHQLISSICFVTVSLTGLQIYLLGFVIIPLQAFSLLWSPRPSGLSTLISEKNTKKHTPRVIRYSIYALIRMLPLILVALAIFVWTLWWTWTPYNSPPSADISKIRYIFGATEGVKGYNPYTDPKFLDALSFSQNMSLFALTLYIVAASTSCIHRTESLLVVSPKHHVRWMMASGISLLLAIIYFLISEHARLTLFTKIHPYMYILLFGWVPCQILLDELVKRHTRAHYKRTQDILKLDYNTKLGMYSPI
jgi:hypothetical protein